MTNDNKISSNKKNRYLDYDVLDKWLSPDFDDHTREVIQQRIEGDKKIRFFFKQEVDILSAVADRIIPQSDREDGEKVPIVARIDEKLFEDHRDGYRYEGLPAQREAWRLGLAGIDQSSRILFNGKDFSSLTATSQDSVLKILQTGKAPGEVWEKMDSAAFFKDILLISIVKIYYAHPLAWNETGYSGPSSPRGHFRKWEGGIDPWEAHEKNGK